MTTDTDISKKNRIAAQIERQMASFALPDSRFQVDFSKFIPDFLGSEAAAGRLASERCYQNARYVFATPDNALISFRWRAIVDGKILVVPTYGLSRGFLVLNPQDVIAGHERYASWLDGVEYFGRVERLADLERQGPLDLVVTGASALNKDGLRFGMGHQYLDIEWGVLSEIGVFQEAMPVAAMVHDVQYTEEVLPIGPQEILANIIVTPTRTLRIDPRTPRPDRLDCTWVDQDMLETPPLQEIRERRIASNHSKRP
jgi:5-formyltetrahydrofolate cyclo-ligase